ncbi:MAG: S8 family serine peptidase [Burkholderiales bacterium]|nr:S8 family serine peptidase [Burkholderiales bacterium]
MSRRLAVLAGAAAAVLLAACQPRTPAPATQASAPAAPALQVQAISPEEVARLFERRVGQPPAAAAFVPGQVIVKLKAGRTTAMAAPELRRLQIETDEQLTSGGERIYRVQPAVARAMEPQAMRERTLELVRTMAARPDVEYAQPNFIFQIGAVPNDPGFVQQWHYQDNGSAAGQVPGGINLPQVWETNKGSANVVVAVIDTGILPAHPDITGSPNLVPGYDMISDAFIANDGGGRDNDPTDPGDGFAAGECGPGSQPQPNSWHGTHVAGTVGVGNTNNGVGVAGINWAVKLQAVRVLGKCGGTMVDINDGIRWAAGLPVPGVPTNATPAKVINMSLGGNSPCSASPATQAAINDAIAAGTTVVVAAGNSAADASGFLPAGCNGVITVAASDARGFLVTRYSNFGPRVDILAPGGDTQRDDTGDGQNDGVLSMVQGGYARYNGTSMASPHVAGVVALMLAARPTLTPAQVLAELKAQAMPRNATQCPRPCGAGLLNARAALGGGSPPPPPPPPPPDGAMVALAPSTATLNIGASTTLVASVSAAGAPLAGKTVTFASTNAAVATVSPATATTDSTGQARVMVAGLTPGTSSVSAAAEGAQAAAAITVAAKVSALSWAGGVAIAVLAVLGGLRAKRLRAAPRP